MSHHVLVTCITMTVLNVHSSNQRSVTPASSFLEPVGGETRTVCHVFLGACGRRDEDSLSRKQVTGKKSSAGNTALRPLILGPQ